MRRTSNPTELRWIVILLAASLAFAAGCASDNVPVEDSQDVPDSEFQDAPPPPPPEPVQETRISAADVRISNIYFDFDRSEIRGEYRQPLGAGAEALKQSGANVVIEGHCDERGSEEYNYALGERRAAAVRKYLYNLGVGMGQMSIVSYGEVRPAVRGRGEDVWQRNRRAEFKVR